MVTMVMVSFSLVEVVDGVAIAVSNFMTNYGGVVTNNIGGVVDILMFFVTMLGDNILTFLNHSSCNYNLMFIMANLFMMALLLENNGFNNPTIDFLLSLLSRQAMDTAGEKQNSADCKHSYWRFFPPSLLERELKMSVFSF